MHEYVDTNIFSFDKQSHRTTNKSHAVGKSIVPDKLQQKLPEKVERAVPNAIHDTGDAHGNPTHPKH